MQFDLFYEDEIEETPVQDDDLVEWKRKKSEARAKMVAMQRLPFEVKKKRSELRANEFIEQMYEREKEAHVSVGGLDSITLHVFLKSIELMCRLFRYPGWKIRAYRRCIKL